MNQEAIIRHFEGREAYETALDELLPHAGTHIRVFDREISPHFNRPRRVEVLRSFLLAGRGHRLSLLAHDPSRVTSQCPRLLVLLRQFSNTVAIHQTPDEAAKIYDPFCVADTRGYTRRFHFDDARGVTSLDDDVTATELARRFDEMWDLSFPALSATVLGL